MYYVAELAIIAGCVFLARVMPGPGAKVEEAKGVRTPRWLFVASLIGFLITMVSGLAAPTLPIPAVARMTIILTAYAACLVFLWRVHVFDNNLELLYRNFRRRLG